ncbi:MAG: DUF4372 domain-containing protein [Owenweeksia sp.]|nr:DUF4372 domain-containing protein [Owenweeksia sp.]
MSQITLLGQVIQCLPRDSFKKLVGHYQTDKHSKGLHSWGHLVSMMFCHQAEADSVRDISNELRSITGNRVVCWCSVFQFDFYFIFINTIVSL